MAMSKVKNLQLWCKKMSEGYRDVEVKDMAASWKSGLAFCAIIHRFRPDLIDYDSLSKENVFENNDMAFEVAEKQLSIPAFLEAADMVAIRVPDKLSVVTYVSQYYNYFHNKPQLGGPGVNKFNPSAAKKKDNMVDNKSLTPTNVNTGSQPINKGRQESMGDKCSICHEKVYLLERHIENARLYHRSCFRKSEQSPTSKVFKKHPSPLEEDKTELSSSKLRKIDPERKMETDEKKGSGDDFWQRRAEAKAKQFANTPVAQKVDAMSAASTKPHAESANVPQWKRDKIDRSDEKLNKPSTEKSNMSSGPVKGVNKVTEPSKSGDLVNKFKDLHDRNLKNAQVRDQQKPSNTTKESDKIKTDNSHNKTSIGAKVADTKTNDSFPVPKHRQNVSKVPEKMDTGGIPSSTPQPKAAPRWQKSAENITPKASPRNIEKNHKSPPLKKKTDFNRPKTPPHRFKGDFSLNFSTAEGGDTRRSDSPSSPPPLPSSSPPKHLEPHILKTPTSDKSKHEVNKSPRSSPRFKRSEPLISPRGEEQIIVPPRPHITSPKAHKTVKDEKKDRVPSPMDTNTSDELPVASRAVIHEPSKEHSAVLVVPKRQNLNDEKNNRAVLGGLLKSLAHVRESDTRDVNVNAKSDKLPGVKDDSGAQKFKVNVDKSDEDVSSRKTKPHRPRPKTSFVSQSSSLFGDEGKGESHGKSVITTKTTTTTTVVTKHTKDGDKNTKTHKVVETKTNDDIPSWKKQLERNKVDKPRPKSADLLNEKKDSGGMLEWQKEAEKRKQARKGGYTDPETERNLNNNTTKPLRPPHKKSEDISDRYIPPVTNGEHDKPKLDRPKSPERRRILPSVPSEQNKQKQGEDGTQSNKKKITLGQKFVFDEPVLLTGPKKPPRPGLAPKSQTATSPTSPKLAPSRPPPPKAGMMSRHHISAYQIQKQLQLIDSKLTELELKGRTMEDSIRNAKEEEEDDLMIDWFTIVNDKNELVRKECDYIYINRQQELELEQEMVDRELRELVDKPEKTEADQEKEEKLVEKIVDLVNQRSKIVDSIDEDRLRYLAEDRDIEAMLQQKAFKLPPKKTPKKSKFKRLGFMKDSKGGVQKEGKAKKKS